MRPFFPLNSLRRLCAGERRTIRGLLRLDALRLAAAQVSYRVIDGAALGSLQLGLQGAGPGFQRVGGVAHASGPGVRHFASGVSMLSRPFTDKCSGTARECRAGGACPPMPG